VEPNWVNKQTHARVSMSEVRPVQPDQKGSAEDRGCQLDKGQRPDPALRHLREEVLGRNYTRTATRLVSAIADPVPLLSQDADGKVNVAAARACSPSTTRCCARWTASDVLVIGGYHFDDFEWDEHDPSASSSGPGSPTSRRANPRRARKIYPDMLYPSEPNALMKAHGRADAGIFQIAAR